MKYVLVTAVRNEESVIAETLNSMVVQTCRPLEWVIVSDGSTDRTNLIIKDFCRKYGWIKLIELPARGNSSLAARIKAINHGLCKVKTPDYELIGVLDGDLRFGPNYYQEVVRCFREDPHLGIAGGRVVDLGADRSVIPWNVADVPGGVQLFRRECFEKQNGYLIIPEGGSDTVACVIARMRGFETRLILDLIVDHLKPRNVWAGGVVRRKWQMGVRDYALGYHPVFTVVKCGSRIREKPVVIGAIARLLGYMSRAVRRYPQSVPVEVVFQIRREQLLRLRGKPVHSGLPCRVS